MGIIYQGRRLSVEKRTHHFPDGTERERVVIYPSNAVAVLPVEEETCYLIRQYRFAIDEYLFEAPAGTMDPGELPADTARRELQEETGLIAGNLISRGFIYTTPGYTTEKLFLFEARNLSSPAPQSLDDDEHIELVRLPKKEVLSMVKDGRIHDAKTICLIHLCLG